MKHYLLISNSEGSKDSVCLGRIDANTIQEAGLFLAYHFPEKYYLANIIGVDDNNNRTGESVMIASADYYRYCNNGELPNPVDVALTRFIGKMMISNGFVDRSTDYATGDEIISIWNAVGSENGSIVKLSEEE